MQYKIVFHETFEGLEYRVNQELQNGWEPCGGPFFREEFGFIQALIKRGA